MSRVQIRFAGEKDAALILEFIKELAVFEGMDDQVAATEEDIRVSLFERKQAEVIIGEVDGVPTAFALFFHNYSTFLGKATLFLEDLFVRERYRGGGIGTAMLQRLSQIAVERGCGRLDWLVLDDNTASAVFYQKYGASALTDRRVYRFDGGNLTAFAEKKLLSGGDI
jgi:GNAT superfamily N-acetyltransferase